MWTWRSTPFAQPISVTNKGHATGDLTPIITCNFVWRLDYQAVTGHIPKSSNKKKVRQALGLWDHNMPAKWKWLYSVGYWGQGVSFWSNRVARFLKDSIPWVQRLYSQHFSIQQEHIVVPTISDEVIMASISRMGQVSCSQVLIKPNLGRTHIWNQPKHHWRRTRSIEWAG